MALARTEQGGFGGNVYRRKFIMTLASLPWIPDAWTAEEHAVVTAAHGGDVATVDPHIQKPIHLWVWSGFYNRADVARMLPDILAREQSSDFSAVIEQEFRVKEAAEAGWPKVTDCDRLRIAFNSLLKQGICALHKTGYEMSDGYSAVSEEIAAAPREQYRGYCFYHGQDVEAAIEGHGLNIAYGDLKDETEASIRIGNLVRNVLEENTLKVVWDGSNQTRLLLPTIKWQRRYGA
jgi:hypothetical protein